MLTLLFEMGLVCVAYVLIAVAIIAAVIYAIACGYRRLGQQTVLPMNLTQTKK
ncbi:MAG TPA: hypothetical protein VG992_04820 [Candidatus Saccharimonadales bacterium]|nr:hypothetical protein [Candidatus Saccharimonadales bacterium]